MLFKQEHSGDMSCMSTRPWNIIRCVPGLQLLPLVAQHKVGHGSREGRKKKEETSRGFILGHC